LSGTGRTVAGYDLGPRLGQGGMGAVYRAVHRATGRVVAFKVLLRDEHATPDTTEAARRMRDEAAAASRVRHPWLVAILEAGDDDSVGPYVVYEYLPGGNLREFLTANDPLSPEQALEAVGRPLLGALAALHAHGVIHRDVKPENMFRRDDGTFALGDLGLAHFEGRQARTRTGFLVGTPGYVAPESLLAAEPVPTPAVDVYAAAALLVEVLTGSGPFEASDVKRIVFAQVDRDVTVARLTGLGVPPCFVGPLVRALARRPDERTATADAFRRELEEALAASPPAGQSPTRTCRPARRRSPIRVVALVAVLSVLVGVAVVGGRDDRDPETESAPPSFLQTEAGVDRVVVHLAARRAEPFVLKDEQGMVQRRGHSLSAGDGHQRIELDRLAPATRYVVTVGGGAASLSTTVATTAAALTGPSWILARPSLLYANVRTNLRSTPLEILVGDEEHPRAVVAGGNGIALMDRLPVGEPWTTWRLRAGGKDLVRGRSWTGPHVPVEGILGGPVLGEVHLRWFERRLILTSTVKGLVVAEQAFEGRRSADVLQPWHRVPYDRPARSLNLVALPRRDGGLTTVAQVAEGFLFLGVGRARSESFPSSWVTGWDVGRRGTMAALAAPAPEGVALALIDVDAERLRAVNLSAPDDTRAPERTAAAALRGDGDLPVALPAQCRFQENGLVGPTSFVDDRIHVLVAVPPPTGGRFAMGQYYTASCSTTGDLGRPTLQDVVPVAALHQAVVPFREHLCFSGLWGIHRVRRDGTPVDLVRPTTIAGYLASPLVVVAGVLYGIVYEPESNSLPTVQVFSARLLTWTGAASPVVDGRIRLYRDSSVGTEVMDVRSFGAVADRYLVGASAKVLFVLDLETGRRAAQLNITEKIHSLALSDDGSVAAFRGDKQLIMTSVELLLAEAALEDER